MHGRTSAYKNYTCGYMKDVEDVEDKVYKSKMQKRGYWAINPKGESQNVYQVKAFCITNQLCRKIVWQTAQSYERGDDVTYKGWKFGFLKGTKTEC